MGQEKYPTVGSQNTQVVSYLLLVSNMHRSGQGPSVSLSPIEGDREIKNIELVVWIKKVRLDDDNNSEWFTVSITRVVFSSFLAPKPLVFF